MTQETKEIEVNPNRLEEELALHRCFGWRTEGEALKIDEESISYEKRRGNIYQVKQTISYYRVKLSRDINIANYRELISLEAAYQRLDTIIEQENEPQRFPRKALVVAGWGLLLAGIPSLVTVIWCLVSYEGRLSRWQKNQAELARQKQEIGAKAKSHLTNGDQ